MSPTYRLATARRRAQIEPQHRTSKTHEDLLDAPASEIRLPLRGHEVSPPSPEQQGDLELLGRFTAGDAGAFEVLLRRYQKPVYNFILHATGDLAAAEELTQDVFMRVIERAHDFRGESKFTTWLYTIARNLSVDHGRRARHRKHRSLDAPFRIGGHRGRDSDPSSLLDRFSHVDPSPERQASSQHVQARLRQAVLGLPEEQREVFLMRQVQQLPFRDIAAVVGVSENTVKSRMRYALERLQEALSDCEELARDAV